jgi:ATP-dependent DNA helicase DinG
MTDAVERALRDERVLVCEAGTGTGKTLAYLVPAILSGKKIVVSTATRALQEQIFTKDIPLIRQTLGLPVSAALMKGLSNYVCRRFDEYRSSADAVLPGVGRAPPSGGAGRTASGDRGDRGLAEDELAWREVSSSSDTRTVSVAPLRRMLRHVHEARSRSSGSSSSIIFVLGSCAPRASRGRRASRLRRRHLRRGPPLEDIATDFFGIRVSSARIHSDPARCRSRVRRAGLSTN